MKLSRKIITLTTSLLVVSCSHWKTQLSYAATQPSPRPMTPREMKEVAVYTTPPKRAHVEVGIIDVRQSFQNPSDMPTLMNEMRQYAGEIGCEALIVSSNDAVVGSSSQFTGTVATVKGFRSTCLVFTGADSPDASTSTSVCIPNSTQLCYGPGGCKGGQSCLADGTGYSPCDCGSTARPATGKTASAAK